jgi:hypothetical protein
MKKSLLTITLLGLFALGSRDLQAQVYDPYWEAIQYQQYLQHQQYLAYLQQYDPYYELHLLHYQLYLQPYRSYYLYQPCCFAWGGVPSLGLSTPIGPAPRPIVGSRSRTAVGPTPRTVSPLPRATGRR